MLVSLLASLASPAEAAPRVSLRVVPAAKVVPPGAVVEVAVVAKLPRGWHIYWENPGQSGIPTDARLRAVVTGAAEPTGRAAEGGAELSVSGPRWPVPARFETDGLVNYGYGDEAAFLFTFTAPADGAVDLLASVDWLLCKEACIPGSGEAEATVRVRPGASAPGEGRVRAHLAALPRPFAESGGVATLADGRLVLRLPRPLALFPSPALEAAWAPVVTAEPSGAGVLVETPLPVGPSHLVLGEAQGHGYLLELPPKESP